MPEIKVQNVVSSSSEDKNHPADNILRPEGTHKWKCATAGEKSVSIVIQFEKASQIHSIDIGNEGSAFIEILVGKSTASSEQDYQVLLPASSFMTPLEARNGSNRCSVRMFGKSNMSATVVNEKWDRVKVVCTQPFNKTNTYGLSFIKFHSPPDPNDKEPPKTSQKNLGFFKMKDENNGEVQTGSLFSHRGKMESPAPVTGAAAARAASRLADEARSKSPAPKMSSSSPAPVDRSKTSTTPSSSSSKTRDDETTQKKKVEIQSKATPSPSQKRKHAVSDDDDTEEDDSDVRPSLRKQSTSLSSVASSVASSTKGGKPPIKKIKSEPAKECAVKEFSKLMDRVVFVLSGFQNPYRAELRDRAMAMGATYKPDWGKSCTHLICAFVSTPKYNQVDGKGKIVSKKWVQDCYKQKKLLPWRDYRMGDAETPDEDSEDEYVPTAKYSPKKKTHTEKNSAKPSPKIPQEADSDDNDYGGDTDSGDDTEDEVRRIKEGQNKASTSKSPTSKKTSPAPNKASPTPKKASPGASGDTGADPYGQDTDEDDVQVAMDTDDTDVGLPELPDFYKDRKFFFYGDLPDKERRLLTRYIIAYNGELEEYMNDTINYVVTACKWDDNFDDALSDNPNLVFVKPKWVHGCHDKTKLLPHQPYIVVPDS